METFSNKCQPIRNILRRSLGGWDGCNGPGIVSFPPSNIQQTTMTLHSIIFTIIRQTYQHSRTYVHSEQTLGHMSICQQTEQIFQPIL